jgi:serine/threonine protein kinase
LNGKGSSSTHRPDRFGRFAVRADLGASRFGPVYIGRDPSTSTRVVIRTFELSRDRREFGVQSDLVDSFRKLCETTVDHQSLARPVASGAEGDIPYVVYSELAGTAMDAVMRQHGPRPVAEVLPRARQLADAIDCAASAGVHHGMLAPGDVFLDGEGTGVTGFGLAQALIKAGIPAEGVAPYGSPQRLAGGPPTLADDIYSLAAITLELLIGTPRDPDQDTSRALREAQGLPERRRLPRPAPHETRVFTTIPGVDAGKLRACFAAAFSEEPGERPATAAEFVARFEEAFSNKRETEEATPPEPPSRQESLVTRERVVDEEPVVDMAPVVGNAPVVAEERVGGQGRAARRRRARARRRERLATSEPIVRETREPEPPAPAQETRRESDVIRLEPIVDDEFLAEEVAPPRRARSMVPVPHDMPDRSGSRAFLAAAIVTVSFGAGFGGGFVVGHFSKPSTGSSDVSHNQPVAAPQLAPTAAEDPQPIAAATPQTAAPVSDEKVSSAGPIAAPETPRPAVAAVQSGRLVLRSTPAGAGVMVDGQSRGVTPMTLGELAFGAHTIEVSHPGHDTRRRRVTLSERRPARTLEFELRPTSTPALATAPAPATATATGSGSLQVASRPSGAQVFVDDSLIGTTPLLLSNIAAGSRRLRIELSGYKMWTTSIQIEPSARSRVAASLEP